MERVQFDREISTKLVNKCSLIWSCLVKSVQNWRGDDSICAWNQYKIGQERTQFGYKIRTELDRTGLNLVMKSVQSIR